MNNRFIRSAVMLTCLLVLLNIAPGSSSAMEQGLYFGFGGNYHTVAGNTDFDGNHFWRPADFSYAVDAPAFDRSGTGLAGRVGFKAMMWALEFQYSQTILNKTKSAFAPTITPEIDGKLFFSFFDLNCKYYLFEGFRAGGYLILGLSYSTMTGEKIKWTPGDYYSTATYSGVAANFGAGIDFYLTQQIFLYGEYLYRINGYTMIDDLELPETEDASFHGVFVGVCYAIPQ